MEIKKTEQILAEYQERIQKLEEENLLLNERLLEYNYLQDKAQTQAAELELQNDELIATRYELELQNEELIISKQEIEVLLNKFNLLFQFAPIGLLLLDDNFEIKQTNEAIEKILGKQSNLLINTSLKDLLSAADFDFIRNLISEPNKHTSEFSIVKHINQKHENKYIKIDFSKLDDKFNKSTHYLLAVSDVTETRLAKIELQKSEQKFHSIFDQSPIGIYRTTPEGKLLMANNALVKMLGYQSIEEAINLNLESKDYPIAEGRESFKQKMLKFGEIKGEKSIWHHKNGSSIIVRENSKAIRGINGEIEYYEGTIEDITIEENLQDTLNAIIKAIPDLLIIVDEDGIYQSVYTSNPELLYAPIDQVIGKNSSEVFPKETADYFNKSVKQALEYNMPQIITYELEALSGFKFFEAIISPISTPNSNGKKLVVFLTRDITSRKQIEIDLVKSNHEKDLFFSIIGYDLREPITALITTSDIFTNYYDKLQPEQVKNYVMQMSNEIYSVKNLLDNLLEWSKAQAGKLDFLLEITDINNIVQDSIGVYINQAKSKDIEIISTIVPKTYCIIDRFMISSVVRNLLSNAVKYSLNNSKIIISSDDIGDFIQIHIQDFGQGIPHKKMKHLFDFDDSLLLGTQKRRLAGLGLSICKTFVERNKGKITVESTFGKGSKFSFTVAKAQLNG